MRIVVAMSGGVDSSVAAAVLAGQGHEVIGLSMRLYDQPEEPAGPGTYPPAPSPSSRSPFGPSRLSHG